MATACGPSHPSDADVRAAIERQINEGLDKVKVLSFKKTDGQASNVSGVQMYEVSYEATSECIDASGCLVMPDSRLNPDLVYSGQKFAGTPSGFKHYDKGSNLITHNKVTLSKSEQGWK
jgi:hypothetical protein